MLMLRLLPTAAMLLFAGTVLRWWLAMMMLLAHASWSQYGGDDERWAWKDYVSVLRVVWLGCLAHAKASAIAVAFCCCWRVRLSYENIIYTRTHALHKYIQWRELSERETHAAATHENRLISFRSWIRCARCRHVASWCRSDVVVCTFLFIPLPENFAHVVVVIFSPTVSSRAFRETGGRRSYAPPASGRSRGENMRLRLFARVRLWGVNGVKRKSAPVSKRSQLADGLSVFFVLFLSFFSSVLVLASHILFAFIAVIPTCRVEKHAVLWKYVSGMLTFCAWVRKFCRTNRTVCLVTLYKYLNELPLNHQRI